MLIYVGNLENIKDIENNLNYNFVKGDIVDEFFINEFFLIYNFDSVLYLVVEFYVDRLIEDLLVFVKINVIGIMNLFNVVKK